MTSLGFSRCRASARTPRAAVMAFAFELDVAVVDTNIARVYARVTGERLTSKRVQVMADDALPIGESWAWNQCLMDLGATVCRPSRPTCPECPVRERCSWQGGEAPDPATGSAGVSGKQSRFEGSDRQARGRLMKALTDGAVERTNLATVMGRDADVADRLLRGLVEEGLCHTDRVTIRLPE